VHLAFVGLPPCDNMELALHLFVAGELIEAGVAPATLMKAQGLDPAQPRIPAGNGPESGEWSGDEG
jgi:hypothetical protein